MRIVKLNCGISVFELKKSIAYKWLYTLNNFVFLFKALCEVIESVITDGKQNSFQLTVFTEDGISFCGFRRRWPDVPVLKPMC